MNFTELLETIDTYAREYIRYVLSVASRSAFKAEAGDFDPKLINFSLISVIFGSFLFDRFVRHAGFSQGDMLDRVVRVFSTWLFIGVLLYVGLNFRSRTRIGFSPSLTIVLRVLPVAFMLSTYAATVVAQIARLFANSACAAWWGYSVLTLAETAIILMFLPISVARYVEYDHSPPTEHPVKHTFGAARTAWLSVLVVGVIISVRGFVVMGELVSGAPAVYAAELKLCGTDKSCVSRLSVRRAVRDQLREIAECF